MLLRPPACFVVAILFVPAWADAEDCTGFVQKLCECKGQPAPVYVRHCRPHGCLCRGCEMPPVSTPVVASMPVAMVPMMPVQLAATQLVAGVNTTVLGGTAVNGVAGVAGTNATANAQLKSQIDELMAMVKSATADRPGTSEAAPSTSASADVQQLDRRINQVMDNVQELSAKVDRLVGVIERKSASDERRLRELEAHHAPKPMKPVPAPPVPDAE
ncbi:MAG: hypothetical protein SFU86_00810 [Pirellulaceae bacterium]|nr:hypothetical protein [Pirellulaceae bacterium]